VCVQDRTGGRDTASSLDVSRRNPTSKIVLCATGVPWPRKCRKSGSALPIEGALFTIWSVIPLTQVAASGNGNPGVYEQLENLEHPRTFECDRPKLDDTVNSRDKTSSLNISLAMYL
jgi:hypothetical protein